MPSNTVSRRDLLPWVAAALLIAGALWMLPQWDLAKAAQRMVIAAARRRIDRQYPELDEQARQEALSRFLIRART